MMAFSSIFKKATSLLGFGGNNLKPPPLDGEIIFCKNNVCVHPPASLTSEKEDHHQGYLTLRSHSDKVCFNPFQPRNYQVSNKLVHEIKFGDIAVMQNCKYKQFVV